MTQSRVLLFAQQEAFSEELTKELAREGVTLQPYNDIYSFAPPSPPESGVLLDPRCANCALKKSIPEQAAVVSAPNPTRLPKAVKNPVEVANMKKAHIRDGCGCDPVDLLAETERGKDRNHGDLRRSEAGGVSLRSGGLPGAQL